MEKIITIKFIVKKEKEKSRQSEPIDQKVLLDIVHFKHSLICKITQQLEGLELCFMPVHIIAVRLQLSKQIQLLEGYRQAEERQKSHFSASTTRTYQYETPQPAVLKIDPIRFDTQVHLYNESEGYGNWNSSSVSFSSVDRLGVSSYPVEREPFIPKIIKVNYIEGSNDQKWSSWDFPWTKKLEVCL